MFRQAYSPWPLVSAIVCSLLTAACASSGSSGLPAAPLTPTYYGRTSLVRFQPLWQSLECCALEYPAEDWNTVSGDQESLVALAPAAGDAMVVLKRARIDVPLTPEEITDVFAEIEMDLIREEEPQAGTFRSLTLDPEGVTVIVTEYTRPGPRGMQSMRQYSFPKGSYLYRLICSAEQSRFVTYERIFAHIAASFRLRQE